MHQELAGSTVRSAPNAETSAEQVTLNDLSNQPAESTGGTNENNAPEENQEKSTVAERAFPGGEPGESKLNHILEDFKDDTRKFAKGLTNTAHNVRSISETTSTERSPYVLSREGSILNGPQSDGNELVAVAHSLESPQESSIPVSSSKNHPGTPKKDMDITTRPPEKDKDESPLSVQGFLHDQCIHSAIPARRWTLKQTFHTFLLSMVLLILGCAPNGAAAAPIGDHHDYRHTATTLWVTFATKGFVLIPAASFLCTARMLIEGRDQRSISTVSVWAMLISVLPLSLFAFNDVHIESSPGTTLSQVALEKNLAKHNTWWVPQLWWRRMFPVWRWWLIWWRTEKAYLSMRIKDSDCPVIQEVLSVPWMFLLTHAPTSTLNPAKASTLKMRITIQSLRHYK
ncbi:hypothetical protein G7Y89_g13860 [Cudoniella acicularis]|uniref:Uncharacterized protein n=1 Tax=Cudoniella acicularis TaxID=354080 RepID=A0A8H4VY99_9HELO|nr:hypothetical protein G7Y89_g13860 [Cudoniella acicularis]